MPQPKPLQSALYLLAGVAGLVVLGHLTWLVEAPPGGRVPTVSSLGTEEPKGIYFDGESWILNDPDLRPTSELDEDFLDEAKVRAARTSQMRSGARWHAFLGENCADGEYRVTRAAKSGTPDVVEFEGRLIGKPDTTLIVRWQVNAMSRGGQYWTVVGLKSAQLNGREVTPVDSLPEAIGALTKQRL
jgi:hypothetical protein